MLQDSCHSPCRAKRIGSSAKSPRLTHALIQRVPGELSPALNRPKHVVDHSPQLTPGLRIIVVVPSHPRMPSKWVQGQHCVCFYSLFNDVVGSSDGIASNYKITSD
jgi:hypothetical protein